MDKIDDSRLRQWVAFGVAIVDTVQWRRHFDTEGGWS
jgi:hypothetical protein